MSVGWIAKMARDGAVGAQLIEQLWAGIETSDDLGTDTAQHAPLTSHLSNMFALSSSRVRRLSMRVFQKEQQQKIKSVNGTHWLR